MKKLFTLFLALGVSAGTMFADKVQIGDLYYNLNDENKTAEVTYQKVWHDNYSGITIASIPTSVEYKSVTYSVTSIGSCAFQYCTGLTTVTIPNSVTSIETYAFDSCCSLTSIDIPNSVTSIGRGAFYDCRSLPVENNLRYADTYLVEAVDKSLSTYVIKDGTKWIGTSAFYGCSGITSVTIPNSVTSIGERAFYRCSGLTSVEIPNSVTSIGEEAFYGCSGITSIDIPNSVTSIGEYAFSDCTGLTGELVIPNSVTSIEYAAFAACTGLTSVTIPNNVTSIGNDAFKYCSGLTSVKISHYAADCSWRISDISLEAKYVEAPTWFFDVQEGKWASCPKYLRSVTINDGEINDNVLSVIGRSYKTLKLLDLSAVTNTELVDEAVKGCYNLESLKFPEGLTKIGYMAVADCKSLQEIAIPASVKEIDNSAFENCRSLKSITFGEQVSGMPGRRNVRMASTSELQRIGNWAFYNCHELQHLEIPEGVTEIGDGAFYGCTYLEDLSLPSSVQTIGDNTFALCSKMKKIIVNASIPPTIQAKTFFDVKRQIPVYVPDECVDAYKNDAYWQEFNIQGRSNLPTSIEDINADSDKPVKVLMEGHIYILRGEHIYDTQGKMVK